MLAILAGDKSFEAEMIEELSAQMEGLATDDVRMTPSPAEAKPEAAHEDVTCRSLESQLVEQSCPTGTTPKQQPGDSWQGWHRDSWENSSWSQENSWWWGVDWSERSLPRAWSSVADGWERNWGYETSRNWTNNRSYSKDLEPVVNPGYGNPNMGPAEHATAALQRSATTMLDQARPTHQAVKKEEQDRQVAAQGRTQAEANVPQAEAHVPQAEAHVPQAEARVPQAEAHVAQAEANVPQAEAHVPQAEAHVPQAEAQQDSSTHAPDAKAAGKFDASTDPEAWRKDKRGCYLKPHALYMRFYRSIRRVNLNYIMHACIHVCLY